MEIVREENETKTVNISDLTADQLREIVLKQEEFIKKIQLDGMFKRLDYLLEILHLSDKFSKKFMDYCANEVEKLIVIDKEAYGI